jgi:hypothetical protein
VVVITGADLSDDDRSRLNGGVEQIIRKPADGTPSFLDEVRKYVSKHAVSENTVQGDQA